jgi:hypothetical protein
MTSCLKRWQGIGSVHHKGIVFSLREGEPGLWRWQYTFAAQIKSGELRTSTGSVAARKVRQMIARDLRIQYILQRERGIT